MKSLSLVAGRTVNIVFLFISVFYQLTGDGQFLQKELFSDTRK